MKKLLLLLLLNTYIQAATLEQVEQYLSLSHAEEDIIALESRYENIQSTFSQDQTTYDMQLLMTRFKNKLQQELSESEMDGILKNYNNLIYLQFVSNQNVETDIQKEDLEALKESSDYEQRISLVKEINQALNKKDIVGIMYDDLMIPFLKNSIGGTRLTKEILQERKDAYIASVIKNSKTELLYSTREFSLDELKELSDIVKSASIEHEKKAIYKATAYAFKEFFLSIASRYDITKHQPKTTTTNTNI